MNGFQDRKGQNIGKAYPGCLGRMVNFFDLSNGVPGNRLLTEKPHFDASLLSRSRSDVTRMLSTPYGDQIEDKMIVSELRRSYSNKKASGTPMKALIAQEMSKEVESKHNPPNVVAKLMGLDTLPRQQPNIVAQRSHSKGYSRRSLSHSGILMECWQQDHSFSDKQCEGHQHQGQNEYKDVYEIWQQSQRTNVRDSSPQNGRYCENVNEKKMAIIREKFMELKRLATDEKSRESKEFQDALDIINANRDLFVKFLQERNSMFSQRLYDMQSIPVSPETKRITVLRPSKVVGDEKLAGPGKKIDKQAKNSAQICQASVWEKNSVEHSPVYAKKGIDEYPTQPTRIVVLKPSPGNNHDIKAVVSPPLSSPKILHNEEFYGEPDDDEAQDSREVAEEITRQMRENIMGHRRDETLLSSVFSNGYIGDDSSFHKSDNEYGLENLSDSEIMSPTSRHSWDYINRYGSPYSCSSFSHALCSPESSVCREAKKRLSERWAMMASNGSSQEPKNSRRSSSTLGEMLALSDAKKSTQTEEESIRREQEPRGSTSCLSNNLSKEGGDADSPRSLSRSKSLPVSSTEYVTRFSAEGSEVSNPEASKVQAHKDLTKSKSMKSSLKGKVSSLFFSRNKKQNKAKLDASQFKDESQSGFPEALDSQVSLSGKIGDDASLFINHNGLEERLSPGLHGSSSSINYPDFIRLGTKQGMVSTEGGLTVSKPAMPGNLGENQDQPSPISVLELPFEEDDSTIREPSGIIKSDRWGTDVPLKSNLIDKSPPIGSIARTLSWDDSRAETATSYSLKPSLISSVAEEKEEDWLSLVQKLLSAAGLNGEMELKSDSIYVRWHSPESPLDPALRDRYANVNGKELLHEAKQRKRRSSEKLVFDCVNATLMEITGHQASDRGTRRSFSCGGDNNRFMEDAPLRLVDHVWGQMKGWFRGGVSCSFEDGGDGNSLVVERVVRNEVVGRGWVDNMSVELDNVAEEIEGKLLEELVEEAVIELTGRV